MLIDLDQCPRGLVVEVPGEPSCAGRGQELYVTSEGDIDRGQRLACLRRWIREREVSLLAEPGKRLSCENDAVLGGCLCERLLAITASHDTSS
jgi:hypothetical protein